jgi:hypothetical protein
LQLTYAPALDDSMTDCLCTFNATSISTVPHDAQPNSHPTMTVEFTDDAHSGSCDGLTAPCPEVNDCGGGANMRSRCSS